MEKDIEEFTNDVRTYAILTRNENYRDRLLEAADYLKSEGVKSLEDFSSRKGLKVGAFTYDEITIFDRIKDEKYAAALAGAYHTIVGTTQEYINNPHIGDELASWGTLGETPYRDKLIQGGYIVEGLTEKESRSRFGV